MSVVGNTHMVELVLGALASGGELGEGSRVRDGLGDGGRVVKVQCGDAHPRVEDGSGALLQVNAATRNNERNTVSQH